MSPHERIMRMERRGERGNMLPLVVVCTIVLFAVLAFSVDQGIAYASKARQENALDAARSACMDASFALVAKSAEDPGALVAEHAMRVLRGEGFEGDVSVWFYEAPEERLPASERLWVVGMQVSEQSKTVFARGYGIEGLPVASWRVMTAVPYAGEKVWRPAKRSCGRFDSVDEKGTGVAFTAMPNLDAYPRELVEAVESAISERSRQ